LGATVEGEHATVIEEMEATPLLETPPPELVPQAMMERPASKVAMAYKR
jgi:hypothetical protein